MDSVLDLTKTYLHLEHGRAEAMQVDERFWSDVTSGARPLPGWLVATFDFPDESDGEGGFSEQHPQGDEIHVCLSGSMRAVLEYGEDTETVDFVAGQTCMVPRGTWHRLVAKQPSRIVSLTFGEGTQHRPAR